jgi:phosphatidylglycerol---prolipoprotein diacylglyceryl transferase
MPLAHLVHDFSPFLIKFSENFGIRYYGLAYLLGFAAGIFLLHRYWRAGRSPFAMNAISDLMTYMIVGVLVGGRLGYFFLYQTGSLLSDPLILLRVWEGGMASHGGFLGVLIAMFWWARRRGVAFFTVSDLIVTTAPAGFLFGRIANFINGELVGKPSEVAWAVIFPKNEIDQALGQLAVPRHPSQLYAAALEGALVLALMQWRIWKTNVARDQPGRLSGEYLVAYAIARVIGEMFREPDAALLLGLSRGTFYSLFMLAAGVVLIARASADRSGGATSKTKA